MTRIVDIESGPNYTGSQLQRFPGQAYIEINKKSTQDTAQGGTVPGCDAPW
jgi:hypothetical protein